MRTGLILFVTLATLLHPASASAEPTEITVRVLGKERAIGHDEVRACITDEGDGFDQQVLEAIRTQAAAKGIAY